LSSTSEKIIPLPAGALSKTIYQNIAGLRKFPNIGRIGLAENTRELMFSRWPYIAVYEIIDDQVQVLRIRHAAQDWP
jgi:toxin ParE1/3/4